MVERTLGEVTAMPPRSFLRSFKMGMLMVTMGTALQTMEGAAVVSAIKSNEIQFEADGAFKATIGPDAAAKNHMQSGPTQK